MLHDNHMAKGIPRLLWRGEHSYQCHGLAFVRVAFHSLEATNICSAAQHVTDSASLPLTCLFVPMCANSPRQAPFVTPFHAARLQGAENYSRRSLTPSSWLGGDAGHWRRGGKAEEFPLAGYLLIYIKCFTLNKKRPQNVCMTWQIGCFFHCSVYYNPVTQ